MDEKPYTVYRGGRGRRPQAAAPDHRPPARREGVPRARATVAPLSAAAQAPEATARGRAGGAARPRARRRLRRWWLIPLIVVLAAIVAAAVWGVSGYHTFSAAVAKSNARIGKSTRAQLVPDAGSLLSHPTTILLLGLDKRPGEPARSDSISLVRVDPRTHSIAQLSIPRDMRVAIPGNGYSKINAAFAWGGPPLALQTVREFTGIPINHIVIVTMSKFPRIVNSVGGIDVYVPKTISSWYPGNRTVTFHKGWNHMNGTRALEYSRFREVDSDFFRMARQQQVLQALEKKLTARGNLLRLPQIGATIMDAVATDLNTHQLLELAYLKWRTPASHSYKNILQGTPQYIDGVDYVISDTATNLALLKQFESR